MMSWNAANGATLLLDALPEAMMLLDAEGTL